jgi:hypothetical protein
MQLWTYHPPGFPVDTIPEIDHILSQWWDHEELGPRYRVILPKLWEIVGTKHFLWCCAHRERYPIADPNEVEWELNVPTEQVGKLYRTSDYQQSHLIFGHDAIVTPKPLVEGPRMPGDPLNDIYRVRDLKAVAHRLFFRYAPFLLAPSSTKIFYAKPILEFWRGLHRAGWLNLGMGIIGYSLPKYDEHALQVLYDVSLNYLESEPNLTIGGRQKTPLRIVDFQSNESEITAFKKRYRFLDGSRTEFNFNGLSDDTAKWVLV